MTINYDEDIIYEIDVDIHNKKKFESVYTKQYDENARWIVVNLYDNGSLYTIPNNTLAYFSATKPDNTGIFNECQIVNNQILYPISLQTTSKDGNFNAEIRLYKTIDNGDGTVTNKLLSTPSFRMHVEKSALDDNTVISSNEFNTLTDAMNSVGDLIVDVNDAISRANTVIDSVNTTNTTVQNAETVRVTNENNRINAESTRVTNENTRKSNETSRVSSEYSRSISESGRVDAEANRVSIENTRVNQESIRQNQETIRQNYYNAYKVCEPYNNAKPFVVGNKVTYQGSTYQCKLNGTGVLPTNTNNWILIAQKGSDGAGGDMFKSYYDPNNKATDVFNSMNSSYNNSSSGLVATNVKDAIDELSSEKIGISNIDTIITTSITQPTNQEINSYWFVEVVR